MRRGVIWRNWWEWGGGELSFEFINNKKRGYAANLIPLPVFTSQLAMPILYNMHCPITLKVFGGNSPFVWNRSSLGLRCCVNFPKRCAQMSEWILVVGGINCGIVECWPWDWCIPVGFFCFNKGGWRQWWWKQNNSEEGRGSRLDYFTCIKKSPTGCQHTIDRGLVNRSPFSWSFSRSNGLSASLK